jgi:hypothetical protein
MQQTSGSSPGLPRAALSNLTSDLMQKWGIHPFPIFTRESLLSFLTMTLLTGRLLLNLLDISNLLDSDMAKRETSSCVREDASFRNRSIAHV